MPFGTFLFVLYRRWIELMVPFAVSSAVLTASGVLLVNNFDAGVAAGCAGAASLGGLAGNIVGPWCDRKLPVASVTVWLAWCVSSVGLLYAASAAVEVLAWVFAGCAGVVLGVYRILRRHALASWGEVWTRRAGPAGRVGATAGAFAGSAVALLPISGVVLVGFALAGLLGVAPSRRASLPASLTAPASPRLRWAMFTQALVVSVLGFGPVVAYVAVVSEVAGAWAVGWAMAVYAAASLTAPVLVSRWPRLAPGSLPALTAYVVLSNMSWLLCFALPVLGVFAARAVSGLSLFVVEGSLDVQAVREHTYAESTVGRSLGGAVAGFGIAVLMGWFGSVLPALAVVAAVSAVAAVCLAVVPRVRHR